MLGGECPICAAYRAGGPAVLHGCVAPRETREPEMPRPAPRDLLWDALRPRMSRDADFTAAINRLAAAMEKLADRLPRAEGAPS